MVTFHFLNRFHGLAKHQQREDRLLKKKLTSVRRTYKECLNNKETYSQTQALNSKNGPTFVAVFAKVS